MKVFFLITASLLSTALPVSAQIYSGQSNSHTSTVSGTHVSDGFNAINQYTTIGGTTYGSDGSSQAIAGTTYHSNGTIYSNIGIITNGPDQSIPGMTINSVEASYTNIGGNTNRTGSTSYTDIGEAKNRPDVNSYINIGTKAYDSNNVICKNNIVATNCN